MTTLNTAMKKTSRSCPLFSIVTLYDFLHEFAAISNVNLMGLLHGEQDLEFHAPIPPEGEFITQGIIQDFYDKGEKKGALVVGKLVTKDKSGKKLFTSRLTLFARLDGGFGGKNISQKSVVFPKGPPDFAVQDEPSPNQPLLYRLSGDLFALHVDQEFAEMSGFEKPIVHGLCTHGFACRALIACLCPKAPEKARRMNCRFTRPLYPGMPLEIRIWKTGDNTAVWKVVNSRTGETVIDKGEFEFGEIPEQTIRFDDKVAVVTGAGSGLGRVYALELARRGAKVVVNDLGGARDGSGQGSSSAADRVVAEIRAAGGQAAANYDSVATEQGGKALVQTAIDAFGTVDILINNAGILQDKSFVKMTPENWRAVMDVHLNGAYFATRPAFAVMKEKGFGRILFTTSAAGLYGNFGQANYGAAKMALVGLMNSLKIEGKKYNIQVNAIAPLAASRLTQDVLPPEWFEKLKPEFVAPMAVYLVSEQCAASGRIYNAAMGGFNRAAVVAGKGVVLGDGKRLPTPEDIQDNWAAISDLSQPTEYPDLNAQVADLMAVSTGTGFGAGLQKPRGFTDPAAVFAAMPDRFLPEKAVGLDLVFQYKITGDKGGEWTCVIKDQACEIREGTADAPNCTLEIIAQDFLDMTNGVLPAMKAYTTGKLKITGDVMKSQLLEKIFKQ